MRLNAKKTVYETYNCILQGMPLLHSSKQLCNSWCNPV